MGALTDIFKSERGFFTILLVVAATVLCAIGKLDVTDWTAYTKWALLIYTAGKTVTGGISAITGKDTDGIPAPKTSSTAVMVTTTAPSSPGVTASGVVGMPTIAIPTIPTDKKGA